MKVSELLEGLKDIAAELDDEKHFSMEKMQTSIENGVVVPLSKLDFLSKTQLAKIDGWIHDSDWDLGPWLAAEILGLKNMNQLELVDKPSDSSYTSSSFDNFSRASGLPTHDETWDALMDSFKVTQGETEGGKLFHVTTQVGTATPLKGKSQRVVLTKENGNVWFAWAKKPKVNEALKDLASLADQLSALEIIAAGVKDRFKEQADYMKQFFPGEDPKDHAEMVLAKIKEYNGEKVLILKPDPEWREWGRGSAKWCSNRVQAVARENNIKVRSQMNPYNRHEVDVTLMSSGASVSPEKFDSIFKNVEGDIHDSTVEKATAHLDSGKSMTITWDQKPKNKRYAHFWESNARSLSTSYRGLAAKAGFRIKATIDKQAKTLTITPADQGRE